LSDGTSGPVGDKPVADLLTQLGFLQLLPLFEGRMITNVRMLARLTRKDYTDLKVPKGPALKIMAECKQLMEGQR
jgi:hypothetical protein